MTYELKSNATSLHTANGDVEEAAGTLCSALVGAPRQRVVGSLLSAMVVRFLLCGG